MDSSSSGYRYWTTYEAEGDKARIIAHYMREQRQAAIAARTGFHLEVFGLGGGLTIGVRATTRRLQPTSIAAAAPTSPSTPPAIASPSIAGPTAARMDAAATTFRRRVLTSPVAEGSARRLDGGLFDPWGGPLPEWVDPNPFPPHPEQPPDPPPGGGGGFLHTSVRIDLYAPGIADPVQTWELPEAYAGTVRTVTYQSQGFPGANAPVRRLGWWRVTVTPTSGEPAMIYVEANAILTRVPFRTRAISKRLFDHLFRVVLEALVPRAFISGTTLKVGIGEDIAHEFGIPQIVKEQNISPIITSAQLRSLKITAESGRKLKEIAQTKNRHPIYLPRIQDNDVVIRIQAAFDRATATAYGFDVGRLNGELGELFLAFSRDLSQLSPVAYLDVDFSLLVDWLISIAGIFTEVDHDIVNTTIEEMIIENEVVFRSYFREVLSRAVGQHAVVHEVSFGSNAWQIRYFDDPPIPNPNTPWRQWLDNFGGSVGGVGGLVDPLELEGAGSAPAGETPTTGETPSEDVPSPEEPVPVASNDPMGVFPEEFKNADDPVALERLDRHQCLVVIMMENRSYDHLLGGLTTARPRPTDEYDGPPSNASNAPCGGFRDRVPLVRVEQIAMGTAIPVDPRHFTKPTAFQMGDGTHLEEGLATGDMQGFARDLFTKSDSPQLAMTMYGEAQLPTYYKLADDFRVADRWFCAHPGPTWPNRYATIMGSIPKIDNHAVDDPIIGFIKDRSIFDTLTSYGIEWKVFESDLSLIRTFDRYRLDDRRVVPIYDDDDGLFRTLTSPYPLPRVMFIEPNFADLPPLATANDDHPPTDLAAGQKFIADICDMIWDTQRFDDCLICITYDEHGGLYDHVSPPGTPKGDPAYRGKIPKLHPLGPDYLGPRVPTFILSPYVSAGKPDHTVYDHTSILKTILVHNRARLPRSVFGSFGERVNGVAHLGQALDLASPRPRPQPFDRERRRPPTTSPLGNAAAVDGILATDAALGIAAAPPSPTPRTVTIHPRTDPLGPTSEPDFHAALRGMLKPRR